MIASNEEETKRIASKLAKNINDTNATICLNGELGSGKTTFSRFLIRSLLSGSLKDLKRSIYHYDFYRLNKIDELIELNYNESITNNICIIEWANKFKRALPSNRIEVNFQIKPKNRRIIEFILLGSFNNKNFLWTQEKSF